MKKDYDSTRIYRNTQKKGASQTYDTPSLMLYDKTYVMNGKQLKNSILQWPIQGKLVPQDPNDEPASVLLDKIRQEKERLIKEKKIKRDKNASIIYRGEDNSRFSF